MNLPKDEPVLLPKEHLMLPEHLNSSESEVVEDSNYTIRTLLSWSAPGRPFQQKAREYFLNILIIVLLIEVILFLFGQYILMILVLSVMFVAYALASVAPHNFHFKVTTEGVQVEDHFFLWQELYDFYFQKRNGEDVLLIRTKAYFPGELTLTLGDVHKNHVRDVLVSYLPFREYVKPTFQEKAGHWLEKNFPLDKQSPHSKS